MRHFQFLHWRKKGSQMKDHDALILKLALDLKAVKKFSTKRSLKILIYEFFTIVFKNHHFYEFVP